MDNPNAMSAQNTRNPVLDSLVNIITSSSNRQWDAEEVEAMHALLLKLAEKEPGGLKRWNQ